MMPEDTLATLLAKVQSTAQGLSSSEARARLKRYGFNEPVTQKRTSLVLRFLSCFANPLALILLLAAIVTRILGDHVNSTIIIVMVVLGAILDFVQTVRSQNTASKLQNSVAPTATALRDGREVEILRREIVPGDVVKLIGGDLVPGDARLLEAHDLHVNEASLTGKSLPTEKEAKEGNPSLNSVYLGTWASAAPRRR